MGQNCNPTITQQQQIFLQSQAQEINLGNPKFNQQIQRQIQLIRRNNQHSIQHLNFYDLENKCQFKEFIKQQTKNGYGELKIDEHKNYFGYFKDNAPHIMGILILSTSHYYIGQFKNGKMHGVGKQIQQNFEFNGQFQNGVRKYGILNTQEYSYEGNFNQNGFHLYGNLKFINGLKYVGQFKNGKYQGKGSLFKDNFLIYQGNFIQNLYSGFGIYYWKNGSKFQGNYKEGKKSGQGKLFINQIQVNGIWEDGQMKINRVAKKICAQVQQEDFSHQIKL